MRPFFRQWCLKEGLTAEDIRKMEEIEREEREFRQRLLRANAGGIKQTRRDRIRSREGLTPQELMSEGYLQPDDFDDDDEREHSSAKQVNIDEDF
jgi:hypothetical protein